MAEFSNAVNQNVAANQPVLFTSNPVPCNRGFVRWREGSGVFNLSGYVPNRYGCRCRQQKSAIYLVDFGANIAIPTGGTVGEISLGIAINGSIIPSSIMRVTPAAVEEFFNVSRAINVQVWRGCCEDVSVVNTSDADILVADANIIFSRPDLAVTY